MSPSHLNGFGVIACESEQDILKLDKVGEENISCQFFQTKSHGGVSDIVGCRAEVDKGLGAFTDVFLQTVYQRPNVMADPSFFGVHIFDADCLRGFFEFFCERRWRNLAFDKDLRERDFDFGLIPDIPFFRHIWFQSLEELRIGAVISGVNGAGHVLRQIGHGLFLL